VHLFCLTPSPFRTFRAFKAPCNAEVFYSTFGVSEEEVSKVIPHHSWRFRVEASVAFSCQVISLSIAFGQVEFITRVRMHVDEGRFSLITNLFETSQDFVVKNS